MPTIALVDGDIYAYEAAAISEVNIDWGDDVISSETDLEKATAHAKKTIESLADKVNADRIIVALSDSKNWRKEILPTYKSNRKDKQKPQLLGPVKEFLTSTFETFVRPTLEADDVLGILATWPKLEGDKVIVTIDKDLGTVPGRIYFSHKPDLGVREIDEAWADYRHLLQALTGDVTDGYSGCPGIGPIKAEKLLEPFCEETKHECYFDLRGGWEAVVGAFAAKGLTEEDALIQARVARICRASDYCFKTKRVRLWTPQM